MSYREIHLQPSACGIRHSGSAHSALVLVLLACAALAQLVSSAAAANATVPALQTGNASVKTVSGAADLSITKFAESTSVPLQHFIRFTLNVTNNGPEAATSITITDALPSSLVFDDVFSNSASCVFSTGTVLCFTGTLAVTQSTSVTITCHPSLTGDVVNTGSAVANELDVTPADDTASAVVTVLPAISGADLTGSAISMRQTCRPVTSGTQCRIRIRYSVSNEGTVPSTRTFTGLYLSPTPVFRTSGSVNLKSLVFRRLAPGKTRRFSQTLNFISEENLTGKYILAVLDAPETLTQSNELNDVIVFGPLQ